MEDKKKVVPLHVLAYFIPVCVLVFAGLIVSLYLSYSHYKVYTDIGYASFCAVSKAINCDTVSQSSYSIFFNLPVPLWGAYGYLFLTVLVLISLDLRNNTMRLLPTQLIVSFTFSIVSLILGAISALKIHSYCFLCISTYAINFFLFFLFLLLIRRYSSGSFLKGVLKDVDFLNKRRTLFFALSAFFSGLLIVLYIIVPQYWHIQSRRVAIDLPSGITEEGDPWIGSVNPEIEIIEYTDYQCFQCKKMHFYLRSLIVEFPDKIRLIHRHFPLDQGVNRFLENSVHPGSGMLAKIAVFAAKQGKFWEANDYLFNYDLSEKSIYLKQISQDLGFDLELFKIGVHRIEVCRKLEQDIKSGIRKKVIGTPAYIINGTVYFGNIPQGVIDHILK